MDFVRGLLTGFATTRWRRRAGYWRDRAAFEQWQNVRVLRHLEWVATRSPFFRALFNGTPSLAAWQAMPPMEKAEWLANFDTMVTVPVQREEAYQVAQSAYTSRDFSSTVNGYTVGLSSGTTGAPGLFIASALERGLWAGTAIATALPRPRRLPVHVALALRANSRLYESLNLGAVRFTWLDLHQPVDTHVRTLHRAPPDVLVGPPSVLNDLVNAGLSISPQRVLCVAESLSADMESRLSVAFDQPVMQLYQATEGFLGASCAHGTLHLNEDVVAIQREIIDEASGRFVPVITDFNRRSQPIIRYRLTDVLVPRADGCRCGSPLAAIERVEGRRDDVWRLPTPNGTPVSIYADQVSLAIGSAVGPALREFTATLRDDGVDVLLEWEDGVDASAQAASVVQSLTTLLLDRGAAPITIRALAGRRLRDDRKHRRVVNARTAA